MDYKPALLLLWIFTLGAVTIAQEIVEDPECLSDAYHLLAFKQELKDPLRRTKGWIVKRKWNVPPPCYWYGVRCSNTSCRVRKLRLPMAKLEGTISGSLGRLTLLEVLNLSHNNFFGSIPSTLNTCSVMIQLDLRHNQLNSTIPNSLGSLRSLERIYLSFNQLEGTLSFPGHQPNLTIFSVEANRMTGYPLTSLIHLNNLAYINLKSNNFSGVIDNKEFYHFAGNATRYLLFAHNRFSGPLPTTVFLELVGVKELDFANNSFCCSIPQEIYTCKELIYIDFSNNLMSGDIDTNISNIWKLRKLFLNNNNFTGNISNGMFNLKKLTELRLDANNLSGPIPKGFGVMKDLIHLNLSANQFSGKIPSDLAKLTQLQYLDLSSNYLTDIIPNAILKNCTRMRSINVSFNMIGGGIPTGLELLANLEEVNMRMCNLNGSIPAGIGNIKQLSLLDLSENVLTGPIPAGLSNLEKLTVLSLGSCGLSGYIPDLGKNSKLKELNLSGNKITGKIPFSVAACSLSLLDLRYNHLEGEVPETSTMWSLSKFALFPGNSDLCGLVIGKDCPSSSSRLAFTVIILVSIALGVLVLTYLILNLQPPEKYSAKELRTITAHFSNSHLIGMGGLCTVYKGVYPDGQIVAVKRLRPEYYIDGKGAFDVERKLVVKVDHPNIVKVKGSCCCKSFLALVMDYMPNGTLDMHLDTMNWSQRLKVSTGIAQAIAYLHGEWSGDVVMRCDIKSSSVLLDEEFTAHLTDIRLVSSPNPFISNGTRSSMFSGSIGYIPPEYPVSGTVTAAGDVYSFGVLMMQLLTGKRTDNVVGLVDLVMQAYPDNLRSVIHPEILRTVGCYSGVSLCTKFALLCTDGNPPQRPTMQDILSMFGQLLNTTTKLTDDGEVLPY